MVENTGKISRCSSFKTGKYPRTQFETIDSNSKAWAQSTCRKPYLCKHCARVEANRRAKGYWQRILELNPTQLEMVTFQPAQKLAITDENIQRLLANVIATLRPACTGALINIHIGKGLHAHAIVTDRCKPLENFHCEDVTDLGAISYVLKYPIQDYYSIAKPKLTKKYLTLAQIVKNSNPTRAIGILSSRAKLSA